MKSGYAKPFDFNQAIAKFSEEDIHKQIIQMQEKIEKGVKEYTDSQIGMNIQTSKSHKKNLRKAQDNAVEIAMQQQKKSRRA